MASSDDDFAETGSPDGIRHPRASRIAKGACRRRPSPHALSNPTCRAVEKRFLEGFDVRTIEEAFAELGLPVPEIPSRWAASLKAQSPWLFSTGSPPQKSLWDIEAYFDGAIAGAIENGLIIGCTCDDTHNWMLHYYLIEDDVVILLQLPWENPDKFRKIGKGGRFACVLRPIQFFCKHMRWIAATDRQQKVRLFHHTFGTLTSLLQELDSVRRGEYRLPGRLAVVFSRGANRFWSWIPKHENVERATLKATTGTTRNSSDDWSYYFDDNVLEGALAALRKL